RHTRWPRDWSSDVCSSDLERHRPKQQRLQALYLRRDLLALLRLPCGQQIQRLEPLLLGPMALLLATLSECLGLSRIGGIGLYILSLPASNSEPCTPAAVAPTFACRAGSATLTAVPSMKTMF